MAGFGLDDAVMEESVEWANILATWFAELADVDSLNVALEPMIPFLARAPEGCGFSEEQLKQRVEETLQTMRSKIVALGLEGKYAADHAASCNIYTQQEPAWFKFITRVMNDKKTRFMNNVISEELSACGLFLKFMRKSLDCLPSAYVHTEECTRGVGWVYPNPQHHDPNAYFFHQKRMFFFSPKSFTTDLDVAKDFSGSDGLRTLIKMEAGCRGYQLHQFSEFPVEKEVLFYVLDEVEVVKAQKSIVVSMEDVNDVSSPKHGGTPDQIVIRQIAVPSNQRETLGTVRSLIELSGKHGCRPLDFLISVMRTGRYPMCRSSLASVSAKLVCEARDALICRLEKHILKRRVLFLVGATGSGKSTIANWLVGAKIDRVAAPEDSGSDDEDQEPRLLIHDERFEVGQDKTHSKTFLPNVRVVGEDVTLIDFIGFGDTNGPEINIAIDLAFRHLVNLAGEAYVLALADVFSGLTERGGALKRQLKKIAGHLPCDKDKGCAWALGITKCDIIFQRGASQCWNACVNVIQEECPWVTDAQIININDVMFHTKKKMEPLSFLAKLMDDLTPQCDPKLTCDCLDATDVEHLAKRFTAADFNSEFNSVLGRLASTLRNKVTSGAAVISDEEIQQESSLKMWQKLIERTESDVDSLIGCTKEVGRLSQGIMGKPPRLCIQEMFPLIDELCSYDQCRLTGCFVAAEDQAMKGLTKVVIHTLNTLTESLKKLRDIKFIRKEHFDAVFQQQKTLREFVDKEMQELGYEDMDDFLGAKVGIGGTFVCAASVGTGFAWSASATSAAAAQYAAAHAAATAAVANAANAAAATASAQAAAAANSVWCSSLGSWAWGASSAASASAASTSASSAAATATAAATAASSAFATAMVGTGFLVLVGIAAAGAMSRKWSGDGYSERIASLYKKGHEAIEEAIKATIAHGKSLGEVKDDIENRKKF